MPGRNKTGPQGDGPMTGRGLGLCAGNSNQGNAGSFGRYASHQGYRHGRGFGHGRGMGYRNREIYNRYADEFVPEISQETMLENEARILKEQLTLVEKRLSDFKKGDINN
ncbi:MAG: DUF5320 domain-containing protein [Bacteroidota bacterium]